MAYGAAIGQLVDVFTQQGCTYFAAAGYDPD
jgi:hypothetical protein